MIQLTPDQEQQLCKAVIAALGVIAGWVARHVTHKRK